MPFFESQIYTDFDDSTDFDPVRNTKFLKLRISLGFVVYFGLMDFRGHSDLNPYL